MSHADLPPPLKRFREGTLGDEVASSAYSEPRVRISFPPDRAEIELDGGEGGVVVKAEGGVLPLAWLVDGAPVKSDPQQREVELPDFGQGFFQLTVVDARGRTDRISIRIK